MYILPRILVLFLCISEVFGFGGYCYFKECCSSSWIQPNLPALKTSLVNQVFGQHIAIDVVYKAIKGHTENPNPEKALVLSFHGWTGGGKNHIINIIAKNLFKKGKDSSYKHQVIATHDFPHQGKLDQYKSLLRDFITERVKRCPVSLFIFDEVDKIPLGLMDTLKPFLDHYHEVGGVDYRKSTFIFLSNTGAHLINAAVLNHWSSGLAREQLSAKEMDDVINKGAFNLEGGLWHSELIKANLVDFFIPFLPLERKHIKQCIKANLEMKGKPTSEEIINQVAKELQYFPEEQKIFSKSGCKKVSSKVDFIVGESVFQ